MNNYKLVRRSVNQLQQLEYEVNVLMELGWKVIGSIIQSECDGTAIFIQQMEYVGNPRKRLADEKSGYVSNSSTGDCVCKNQITTN